MKLASFDIFDTVLIRKCGRPENIFYLLACRLFPDDPAKREDFLLWRRNAEAKATARNSGKEVLLTDIYADDVLSGFEEYSIAELVEAEKSVEAENLMANPGMLEIIRQKRANGWQICFISDMYLDSRFLTAVLKREGCIAEGERVFVSCEHNARKSNGRLFDLVRAQLNPDEWMHYGDHRISDVKIPRKKGIRAIKADTEFSATEQVVFRQSSALRNPYPLSVVTGLSRAYRLMTHNDQFSAIASDFISPAYIPYVRFVLEEAQQRGIRQLYFLSRDSYVLMKAAQQMLPNSTDVEIRYLFVSRKSLTPPFLKDATKEAFLSVMDKNTVMRKNVGSLLSQMGIDRQQLSDKYGISFPYDKIVRKEQEQDFLEKIFDSPFTEEYKRFARSRYKLLLAYFRQEGLLNGKKSAMVDVGWLGTSRWMINSILETAGYQRVEFFYYGIRGDVLPCKYGRYHTYFGVGQLSTAATALIENYFSASPYPSTVGYRQVAEEIVPEFAHGKVFEESKIVKANIAAVEWISRNVKEIPDLDRHSMFLWAKSSIDSLVNLKEKIDLAPFVQCSDFDSVPFVCRLSFRQFLGLVAFGKQQTGFDKASLQLTCGGLTPIFWRIHCFSGRIRRFLFLKFGNR